MKTTFNLKEIKLIASACKIKNSKKDITFGSALIEAQYNKQVKRIKKENKQNEKLFKSGDI